MSSLTYLEVVNIVLREGGIIAGDDDEVTSFSETQHENHLNLAKRAVKRELNDLLSDKTIGFEEAEATLTMQTGVRTYDLASDFIKFTDPKPFMLEIDSNDESLNRKVYNYHGQEQSIRRDLTDYRDTTGSPQYFYKADGSSHKVGFYPVPNSDANGEIYRYWYQKEITISTETDLIPVINAQAAESFAEGCTIHFNYLRMTPQDRQVLFPRGLQFDPSLQQARAKTLEFISAFAPPVKYGRKYG